MIEVLILIAVALIGIVLVLGRISLTLKGILEAQAAIQGSGTLSSPTVGNPEDGAYRTQTASSMNNTKDQGAHTAEPPSAENGGATDALQDIAAVVAVAERARRQGSSEPRAS